MMKRHVVIQRKNISLILNKQQTMLVWVMKNTVRIENAKYKNAKITHI